MPKVPQGVQLTEVARVELGDVALAVRAFGAGPPLLLLHGLGSSGDDWAFQIGPLAERYRLIVPDLRGCGRSSTPDQGYTIEQFAADGWQLLDHLGVARCAIAGFSMGGAVALEMALQRPSAVGDLVLINSLPSYRIDHWRKALEYYLQVALVRLVGMRRTARMIAARLFPHAHQQPMRQRVIEVIGASDSAPYLRCARALADWCAAERVGLLQARVLMIAGEHDYTALDEKHVWADRLSAQLLVVEGSRHGTPFDAIRACNTAILDFLAGAEAGGRARMDSAAEMPSKPPALPEQIDWQAG
jgi:pimeloyl-ACP methyl ester carboxylesterase